MFATSGTRCKHWVLLRVPWRQLVAKPVLYTEGSVAVLCNEGKVSLDGVLTGKTKDTWVHWQDHILRDHALQGSRVSRLSTRDSKAL